MASHPVICSPAIFVVVSTGSGADEPESEESLLVSPADGAVVGVTGAGAGVGVTGAGAGVGVTDDFQNHPMLCPEFSERNRYTYSSSLVPDFPEPGYSLHLRIRC